MPWDPLNKRLVDEFGRPDPGSMDYSIYHPADPTQPDPLAPDPIPPRMGRAEAQGLFENYTKPEPWDAKRIIGTILGVPLLPLKALSGIDQAIKGAAGIPTLEDTAAAGRAAYGGQPYEEPNAVDRFIGQITGSARDEEQATARISALIAQRALQRKQGIANNLSLQNLESGSYDLRRKELEAPYVEPNARYGAMSTEFGGKHSRLNFLLDQLYAPGERDRARQLGELSLKKGYAEQPYYEPNARFGAMSTEAGAKEAELRYDVDKDYLRKSAEQDYLTGDFEKRLKELGVSEAEQREQAHAQLQALLAARLRTGVPSLLSGVLSGEASPEPEAYKGFLELENAARGARNPEGFTPTEADATARAKAAQEAQLLATARQELDAIVDRDIKGLGKPHTQLYNFAYPEENVQVIGQKLGELRRIVDAALDDKEDGITIAQARKVMARTNRIEEYTTKYATPAGLPMSLSTPAPPKASPEPAAAAPEGGHDVLKGPSERAQQTAAKSHIEIRDAARMEASRRGIKEGSQEYHDLVDSMLDQARERGELAR